MDVEKIININTPTENIDLLQTMSLQTVSQLEIWKEKVCTTFGTTFAKLGYLYFKWSTIVHLLDFLQTMSLHIISQLRNWKGKVCTTELYI